jgi:hypothetical protein
MGAQYLAQRAPTPASCQLGARALNNCVTPPILSSGCWRGRPGELPGPGCRPSRHRFDLLEKKEGEQRGLGCGRRAAHPRGFGCWSGEPRLRPHTPHAGPRELHGAGCQPSCRRFDLPEKKKGSRGGGLGCKRRAARPRGSGCWTGERHAQSWRAPPTSNAAGLSKGSRRGLGCGRHVQVRELPGPGCVPAWRALPSGHGGRWRIGGVARRGRRKDRWRRRGMGGG